MQFKYKALNDKEYAQATDEQLFHNRRRFLKLGTGALVSTLSLDALLAETNYDKVLPLDFKPFTQEENQKINQETLTLTSIEDTTSYNNFYEFGYGKSDPKKRGHLLKTKPWYISIEGEVEKPFTIELTDLLSQVNLVERIYRFRCVEAWSMVIPWIGFEFNELIALAKPTAKAKYVRLSTLYDPKQMPMQASSFQAIAFPYQEGLTMQEAKIPLTLLAVGMYKKELLAQNGAPIRLVVPWKYGYKNIKSINKIEFVQEQFMPTWEAENPKEYGFYGNVDPEVSHPRWSQAYERVIGQRGRKKTLYLNGYQKDVAHLYAGLDRSKLY